MEVVLKQDVDNLGYKNQIVKVKNGYGRNYLIPKGYAILATESLKKVVAETIKQKAFKEEKIKNDARKISNTLKEMLVKVGTKAGEKGKIFGSVTSHQVASAIKALGYEIDRKDIIIINEPIKTVGKYEAQIRFHRDIVETVNFEVVAE